MILDLAACHADVGIRMSNDPTLGARLCCGCRAHTRNIETYIGNK